MNNTLNTFLISFLFCISLNAQFHEPVLPTLEDQDLLDNLVTDFKPATVLGFAQAKDMMYSEIDMHNDSVTCVYTGHTLYVDPNEDPSQYVYLGGASNGINAEHTFPQGMGASEGNARANLYHLYPTRTPVNGARANSPFGEIDDAQTTTWFYLNSSNSSIPSTNIDLYSENISGQVFEPREDHKGDVARAMFYFYTMYKSEADAANSTFFESQRETLCQWHYADPVDQWEWDRNDKIAPHQSNKKNPFILDCTLPERCFCSDMQLSCNPFPNATQDWSSFLKIEQNKPNPFSEATMIQYELSESFHVQLTIYNLLGEQITVLVDDHQTEGVYAISLDQKKQIEQLGKGIAFYKIDLSNDTQHFSVVRKMIVF